MLFQTDTPPFDYNFAVPIFIFWIMISIFIILLIDIKMFSRKVRFTILIVTTLFAGALFGGFPNLLMPIQQIFSTIAVRGDLIKLNPVIIILGGLLLSTIFLGRILCGFACPLGTLQELISKINFKSDVKAQKKTDFILKPPQ